MKTKIPYDDRQALAVELSVNFGVNPQMTLCDRGRQGVNRSVLISFSFYLGAVRIVERCMVFGIREQLASRTLVGLNSVNIRIRT